MSQAVAQSAIRNPQSAIAPAASVPPGWIAASRVAERLNCTVRHIQQQCRSGAIRAVQGQGRFGLTWYCDPACLDAVSNPQSAIRNPQSTKPVLADLSNAKRQGLQMRLAAVEEYLAALDHRGDLTREKIGELFVSTWNARGHKPRLAVRTLRRWARQYQDRGAAAVVDERRWHGALGITPDAWDFIQGQWLSENRPPLTTIYEQAEFLAQQSNWALPSYRHICRMIKALDRKLALAGRDPRAFRDRCLSYVSRDWSHVPAMGCWVADHRQFDVLIPHEVEVEKGGKIVAKIWRWHRPWLTMYLDARSWMPAAWSISWETPDGNRTMATFIRGVREHGAPAHVYLDNGKDFRMAAFSGGRWRGTKASAGGAIVQEQPTRSMLEILGCGVTFALPFNAKAKPVEPWFKFAAEHFDKRWKTYCGNKTERKPEFVQKLLANCGAKSAQEWSAEGLTLDGFSAAFNKWITEDYALRESPAEAAKPLSALRAFRELRPEGYEPRRPADEDLTLLLMPSRPVAVQANGIWIGEPFWCWYWSDMLESRRCAGSRKGGRVVVRYDPDDSSGIYVFDAEDGRYLARATPYIGSGLHPLASATVDGDRLASVMALRAGQAILAAREVNHLRGRSENLLLEGARLAGATLGRFDDPLSIAPPPAATIRLSEVSAAGLDLEKESSKFKVQSSKSAADLMAEFEKVQADGVGAPDALDVLVGRREAGRTDKEPENDRDPGDGNAAG